MNLMIHDLSKEEFNNLFHNLDENTHIISDTGNIKSCIGCFGCWIKTPGKCILKDEYNNMGELLAQADKVTIISKCCYGCYSPFVKNILDRSISYILPFFKIRNDETHHKRRYKNEFSLSVYFYGTNNSQEMKTAQAMVKANCRNFYVERYQVTFVNSIEELSGEEIVI